MGQLRIIASFEIHPLSKPQLQNFDRNEALTGLPETISRLLGRSVGTPGVTSSFYSLKKDIDISGTLIKVDYVRLYDANDVLTVIIELSTDSSEDVLLEANNGINNTQEVLTRTLGIKFATENVIYPVAGALLIDLKCEGSKLNEDWICEISDTRNAGFKTEIYRQLITRVAIERSLLNWASSSPNAKFWLRMVWVPYVSFRLGQFKVNLLPDRSDINRKYIKMRDTFNLVEVRAELLATGKTFWTVSAVFISIIAIIASFFVRNNS